MGKNTATVVRVDAVTAPATSAAPSTAPRIGSPVSFCLRKIDSSTTMLESTNRPIPRASPPNDMMLRDVSEM